MLAKPEGTSVIAPLGLRDPLGKPSGDGTTSAEPNLLLSRVRPQLKIRTGPSGVHIFDRATGLNVLLEEACVPPALWATAPRQVSVALTNTCDLACTHCFAPKNPAELSFERVATWLDELDANGCLGVGFGGGEPTLYRHLVKLCHYAATQTGLAVTFTTHAHHLDDSLAEALAGAVHFVRISMDGVGATYEAIRGRSFSALRRRFETARRLSPLGINFVVNAQTLPDLDAAATLAAEVGASEILLLPEQPHQGKGGIDAGTFDFLCRWVNLHNGTVPLTVSETGADGLPTCDPLPGETGLCAYAHIDASGRLKTSSYAGNGVVIGDAGVMRALNVLRTTQKEGLE